jgi:hypothetical protein
MPRPAASMMYSGQCVVVTHRPAAPLPAYRRQLIREPWLQGAYDIAELLDPGPVS